MVDLQKKLSRKQLAQYKREEMYAKAGNLNIGMTTRSQSQAGMGFASRVQPMMQTMETSFGGSGAAMTRNISSNNLTSPSSIRRNTSSSNLMTASPNSSIQFGRSYGTRSTINNNDMDSGNFSNRAGTIPNRTSFATQFTNPLYAGGFDNIDLGNPTLDASASFASALNQKLTMRQRLGTFFKRQQPKAAGRSVTFTNPAYVGLDDFDFGGGSNEASASNFAELKQKYSPKQRLINALKEMRKPKQAAVQGENIPLLDLMQDFDEHGNQTFVLARGSVPREEFMRYANAGRMQYPNIMRMVKKGIQRHKRGLMIAGGVIGGAAIVGGIIGGTLTQQAKRRRKEMQNDSPVGVFERLSDSSGVGGSGGGGGSGGYGNYQRQMPFTGYGDGGGAHKAPTRRRYKKKKTATRKHKAAKRGRKSC